MTGMQACLILYTVGPLIGTWIVSGVVPTMIYYGLAILSPSILFATAHLLQLYHSRPVHHGYVRNCRHSSYGDRAWSWCPAPLTAGVVISGAYFGDKMSPLSDTTNLAPAVAGTDLFQHIRAMVWTTGPTYVIVAAITLVIGFRYAGGELDTAKIAAIQALMDAEFWINPVTLLAPVVVIGLSAARKPALPSLWAGIFVAIIIAAINGTDLAISSISCSMAIHPPFQPL